MQRYKNLCRNIINRRETQIEGMHKLIWALIVLVHYQDPLQLPDNLSIANYTETCTRIKKKYK